MNIIDPLHGLNSQKFVEPMAILDFEKKKDIVIIPQTYREIFNSPQLHGAHNGYPGIQSLSQLQSLGNAVLQNKFTIYLQLANIN